VRDPPVREERLLFLPARYVRTDLSGRANLEPLPG
jgi:hypothetical protein